MSRGHSISSAEIKKGLSHPVVDSDGHMIEHMPVFVEFLKQVAGAKMVRRFQQRSQDKPEGQWYQLGQKKLRDYRYARPPFFAVPAKHTLDRATAMLPGLMRARMEEFGFDFGVIYPTLGFFLFDEPEEDMRKAVCRAHNMMTADLFRAHADRLTPAAVIPMFTPEEGIAELTHCVKKLGFKAAMVANLVHRPIKKAAKSKNGEVARWIDPLALDSEYDYDPFWATCVKLGVAPTAHSFMQGHGWRRSVSNYVYNQSGHFADAGEAFCKAVFLGGVTKRFPTLKFGILEGGVGWAISIFSTLVEVWQKRGPEGIDELDPANLDLKALDKYFRKYGGKHFKGTLGDSGGVAYDTCTSTTGNRDTDMALLDDFAAADIKRVDDFMDRFVNAFWFGCEAEDALAPVALSGRGLPLGARLKATFGSDIGHWDVPVMNEVLGEVHEAVQAGLMTEDEMRDFTYVNPAMLHASMNPDFFKGTAVESDVAKLLKKEKKERRAMAAE